MAPFASRTPACARCRDIRSAEANSNGRDPVIPKPMTPLNKLRRVSCPAQSPTADPPERCSPTTDGSDSRIDHKGPRRKTRPASTPPTCPNSPRRPSGRSQTTLLSPPSPAPELTTRHHRSPSGPHPAATPRRPNLAVTPLKRHGRTTAQKRQPNHASADHRPASTKRARTHQLVPTAQARNHHTALTAPSRANRTGSDAEDRPSHAVPCRPRPR